MRVVQSLQLLQAAVWISCSWYATRMEQSQRGQGGVGSREVTLLLQGPTLLCGLHVRMCATNTALLIMSSAVFKWKQLSNPTSFVTSQTPSSPSEDSSGSSEEQHPVHLHLCNVTYKPAVECSATAVTHSECSATAVSAAQPCPAAVQLHGQCPANNEHPSPVRCNWSCALCTRLRCGTAAIDTRT